MNFQIKTLPLAGGTRAHATPEKHRTDRRWLATLGLVLTANACVAEDASEFELRDDGAAYAETEDVEVSVSSHRAALAQSGTEADYQDPGRDDWTQVDPQDCGLDVTKLADSDVDNYAVFRHGKLCFQKGSNAVGPMFSATKTLGGVMVGRAAYLTRNVPRTRPGTGTILPEDRASDWVGRVSYNDDATLAHVMAMVADNDDLSYGEKTWTYDTVGTQQINSLLEVSHRAVRQIRWFGANPWSFVEREIFEEMGMDHSVWAPGPLGIASGWWGNLSDMGKLGTLLLHDGWYGGKRLLARQWVYRMSHPAFEDANTSYGQLTWLNHRGNAAGTGGNVTSDGSEFPAGDPCAPAAVWPSYPHGLSQATDCRATCSDSSPACADACTQHHDVGVFSAQGLLGQFVVMHPGLDLVIAARNYDVKDGPIRLWNAVRPALRAMDPVFGADADDQAFCEAYGSGSYAPDLPMPRHP